MNREQIWENLKAKGYPLLPNSNFILENKDSRIYALGKIAQSDESKYLAKVILYQTTSNNRESMLQLENFLIDSNVPFQHQKR